MDTDLVLRAQQGDKGAYATLAVGIAGRFLAVARRILRDIDLAEDATQQALLGEHSAGGLRSRVTSSRSAIGSARRRSPTRIDPPM